MSSIEIKSHRGNYRVVFDNSDIKIENSSFVLIDSNVNRLYPSLTSGLDSNKIIIIEAREENKSLEFCKNLISRLLDEGIKKNHNLIAIGGGSLKI